MTPDERELRRALEARSGSPSPEFRARVSAALAADKPAASFMPALAAVAAAILVFATVGVLLLARQLHTLPPVGGTSIPRLSTPSPTRGVEATPSPIELPSTVQLSAPSGTVVWALVAYQYLARSTDRGVTWTHEALPPSVGGFPRPEISFVNDHEGWLTTGGSPETQCNAETVAIWHTTDGGATWQLLGSNGIGDSQCKAELSFVDSNRGFLDAFDPNHAPRIYHTTDGGLNWVASRALPNPPGFTSHDSGFTLQPGRVSAFGSTLLVSASMHNSGGNIEFVFKSIDGGATWAYLAKAKDPNNQVDFVTATRWIELIAPGQSFETTDAGATWHLYSSAYTQAAPIAADFVFADANVGYATVRGEIFRTVDGGRHWATLHTPGT